MRNVGQYAGYTAIQLAADVDFIRWVRFNDPVSDRFWTEYLRQYPSQAPVVARAKAIVNEMNIVSEPVNEGIAAETWQNIERRVRESEEVGAGSTEGGDRGEGGRAVPMYRKWWAAAAVIAVIAIGGYYFMRSTGSDETNVAAKSQQPVANPADVAAGSDKAKLTLADGTIITLDSANNGAISKQGVVTIIKIDGKLQYLNTDAAKQNPIGYNTITTPKGGQYQLELADGTLVWLNAASSLRFPTGFSGSERKVQLTGEGYFEVAGNKALPFIVETGETSVRVLGTHFNINGYDDESSTNITLLEGSVKISKGNSELVLKPGQQAQVSSGINLVRDVNIDNVMAWKNGWFEFDNTDLSAIMRQIGRWYDVEIVYDGSPGNHQYGGRISKYLPLSEILKMLESNGAKGFRLEGKKLVVLP